MEESKSYKEQAVERFSSDIYAVETTGVRIEEAGVNYSKCSLEIDRRHFNAHGDVMGGAIFTLADYAFGVAANTGNPPTVSLSGTINFLRASKGPVLYAGVKCVKNGKSIAFFEVTVTDSAGNVVATVMANGFVMQGK